MKKEAGLVIFFLIFSWIIIPGLLSAQILLGEIYEGAFLDIKVPIYIIDPEKLIITDANTAAAEYYGYPLDFMREMPVSVISLMPTSILTANFAMALAGEKNYFVLKQRLSSYEIRDVEIYSSPVIKNGKTYLLSIVHDITSKTLTERRLKESESRLLTAESFAKYGHWIFDLKSGTVSASEGARILYGLGSYTWSILEVQTIPLPQYREQLDNALKNLITNDIPYNITFQIKRPTDGKIIDIHSTAKYDSDNNIVFGIIQDVTEQTQTVSLLKRNTFIFIAILLIILFFQFVVIILFNKAVKQRKKAQSDLQEKSDELAKSRYLLSKIFEILPIGLWIADKNGKLITGNPAGVKIWGAEPHASIEEYGVFKARNYISGEEIKPEDWALAHTVREGKTIQNELLEIDAFDGEKRIIINHTAPVTDNDGNLINAIVVNQDITDLKKAENDRLSFETKIQQTQKLESLGILAGGIAHDFNNILMAVLGHAELALLELSESSPAGNNIAEIQKAAKKGAEISSQMLAYSGQTSFLKEEIDIRILIEEMLIFFKTLITKKAVLNLNIEDNLPPVAADPGQIRQIIMNLILNASDAIADNSGVISISAETAEIDDKYPDNSELDGEITPGLYIKIKVSDTGCGMQPSEILKVFDPFYTTKAVGRGLGLAAAKGIIKTHNGSIKVFSEPGKGTSFILHIPAIESVKSRKALENQSQDDSSWKSSGTVLFVDDEESLRVIGCRMLENMGFDVITADNGFEAVEVYMKRKDEIDLVILDLTMPRMDGSQTFAELIKINENVQVILASGYSREDVESRFAGKSLLGIIQKPYTIKKLKSLLKLLF